MEQIRDDHRSVAMSKFIDVQADNTASIDTKESESINTESKSIDASSSIIIDWQLREEG